MLGASPFAGYMYDLKGDYSLAFEILAALNFLGALLLLMARKPVLRTVDEGTKITHEKPVLP